MHRVIYRPSTKLLNRSGKGVPSNDTPSVPTQAKTQTSLPWGAIALFLDDGPKVDLRQYPHLRGVLERFKAVPVYCFEAVPDTLAALLKAHFGAVYGSGSCFMKSGDHEVIILDFGQIRQCSQRLGCGIEQVAIAAFLHEYGHNLANLAGLPNTEFTAWQWARRLNKLHRFVPSGLLADFEALLQP